MAVKDCPYCFVDAEHNYVELCSICFGQVVRAYNANLDARRSKLPRATRIIQPIRG